MFEKCLVGGRGYWALVCGLLATIGLGFYFYLKQWVIGLGITGMSINVSWGLYIANFTFLVGVAASAVMVVLPYYLHDYKKFGRITTLGEFLAVGALVMCMLFILVDLGQPKRVLNVLLYASPNSVFFWDFISLSVYLLVNIIGGWASLDALRKGEPPAVWVKPLMFFSVPWAISIHTVTAYIYCGLGARPYWHTAILAPSFLASAFSSGPALLILLCLFLRRFAGFDVGWEAINKVAQIVSYALCVHVFFMLCKFFTVYYAQEPHHMAFYDYLYFGLEGKAGLKPWIWTSIVLACIGLILMVNPKTRRRQNSFLIAGCLAVISSIWIEKGLGLVIPGYIPAPTGVVFEYWPTGPEALITLGVWGIGFLLITILYKIAVGVLVEVAK